MRSSQGLEQNQLSNHSGSCSTSDPVFEAAVQRGPSQNEEAMETTALPAVRKYRTLFITVLIVFSNIVQMMFNMLGLAAGLAISAALGVAVGPGQANWTAASYPLTQGTFVLISGRLGAVYGHRNVLLAGAAWLVAWAVANGFATNLVFFVTARALSGVGGALIMPNAVALISTTLPPGRGRNISLGFFGASAPIGSWLGAVLAGVLVDSIGWKWIFFILAIIGTGIFGTLFLLLPSERPVDPKGKIDVIGAALGTGGLILFNVAWNEAPSSGWNTPYEIVLIIISVIMLALFAVWETRYTSFPIMPMDIWAAPSFLPLVVVVLFSFMSNGIFLWYMVAWLQLLRHLSVLEFAIQWTPFVIFATIGTFIAAFLIPRLAAQWILAIGTATVIVSNVLLATMPVQQTYWAQVFPATVLMSFCPDFVYTAAQIIACNSVKRSQQGVAASLIGTLNLYGNSLGLGFAGTIETEINRHRQDPVLGYRMALSFGAVIAVIGLALDVLLVRVVKDKREGWDEPTNSQVHDETTPRGSPSGIELH